MERTETGSLQFREGSTAFQYLSKYLGLRLGLPKTALQPPRKSDLDRAYVLR